MLETLKNKNIKLIALDLDGTLFLPDGTISERNKKAIKAAADKGIIVCLSSGRPLSGLPCEEAVMLGMRYAITTNGSSVYDMTDKSLLGENTMATELTLELLSSLKDYEISRDMYISGIAKSQGNAETYLAFLNKQPHLTGGIKDYLVRTRSFVPSLYDYIKENSLTPQKITLNFINEGEGKFKDRAEVEAILRARDDITVVSGGFGDLEITAKGIDKANGMRILCEKLNIDKKNAMAIGDTENDLAMILYSGAGVAMANSEEIVLQNAEYVTASNLEDGVAQAIEMIL